MWKEYFATFPYRTTFNEVPPLENDMQSHCNVRMRTAPRISKFIFVINTFKRSKAAELDVSLVEFFHVASAVSGKSIRPGVAKIISKLF